MTRDEWVERYVEAMTAGGSKLPERELFAHAESECDLTEQRYPDPDGWEDPEVIAEEDLISEFTG